MNRIERSQLFHRLVSAISFGDRDARGQLSHGQIYKLCDIICDAICSESFMVVSASVSGFSHAVTGKFGQDEPWPEWCDPHGLQRDFGIEPSDGVQLPLDGAATSLRNI